MSIPDSNAAPATCNLASAEFMRRKQTVISEFRNKILESKETADGFLYKFDGSDARIDQLTEFIKTERECCNFFTFTLHVAKPGEFIWLELAGPAGSKEFIKSELEL